jgi:hypothetical protein
MPSITLVSLDRKKEYIYMRLPFSSPPKARRVTVEIFDPASTRVATCTSQHAPLIRARHGPQGKHRCPVTGLHAAVPNRHYPYNIPKRKSLHIFAMRRPILLPAGAKGPNTIWKSQILTEISGLLRPTAGKQKLY